MPGVSKNPIWVISPTKIQQSPRASFDVEMHIATILVRRWEELVDCIDRASFRLESEQIQLELRLSRLADT